MGDFHPYSSAECERFKRNERDYQENKYAHQLEAMNERLSLTEFKRRYLTPIHHGGSSRGVLLTRAIDLLLEHDIRGKRILDYCCGSGYLSVYLAKLGAAVSAVDVSTSAIQCTRRRAEANNVHIDAHVGDCEALPFREGEFDLVIGIEALHHVIVYPNMPLELARITKADAEIVFAENWGFDNPLLSFIRATFTMRKGRSSERGEMVLGHAILRERLKPVFDYKVSAFSLTYMLKRVVPTRWVTSALYSLDALLPSMPDMCGESVIILKKRATNRVPRIEEVPGAAREIGAASNRSRTPDV
jgi:2-polyprenyl-3-methyl-5-hydroxy-6-metoxy-1,4-benzoquinol methylase